MNMPSNVYSTKLDWVLVQIREKIIDGTYPPGHKLQLKQLASDFDVSEQPVREALRYLQSEGLVESVAHVGTVVTNLDPEEVREVFEIRAMLEAHSIRRSFHRFDRRLFGQLEEKMALMKMYLEMDEGAAYGRTNREFHALLHSKSIPYLQNMISNCWLHTRSYFRNNPIRKDTSFPEHVEIMDALMHGDIDKAAERLHSHTIKILSEVKDFESAQRQGDRMETATAGPSVLVEKPTE
jgi:DNA-binding GntR family transcriptional regulator